MLVLVKQEAMRTETGGPYASREDAVKAALKAAMATGTCICVECIVDDYFHRHHMIPYDQFSFALRFIMLCHSQELPTLHGSINVRPEHNGPLEEALRLLGVEFAAFRHWHVFADGFNQDSTGYDRRRRGSSGGSLSTDEARLLLGEAVDGTVDGVVGSLT